MNKSAKLFTATIAVLLAGAASAQAQFFHPMPHPGMMMPPPVMMPMPMPIPMPPPPFFGPGSGPLPMPAPQQQGLGGLPGAGLLPQDGQLVASIAQQCGGNPKCMAIAWGSVEIQRCRNGIGVSGGCFGPNGEIFRVLNRTLPHNLRPTVIIDNARKDITHGPGRNNDLVGCNGALSRALGRGC